MNRQEDLNQTVVEDRRSFLKTLAIGCCAAAALGKVNLAEAQPVPTNAVDPAADPIAKALGYYEDATKVDVAAFPKRAGAEGAKQFCDNCVLLAQRGLSVSGKTGEWGKCTVIQSGLVNAKGWCNSWTLKPGA